MNKNILISLLIVILLGIAVFIGLNTEKFAHRPDTMLLTTTNPEFQMITDFSNTTIEAKCPYYLPDGHTYKQCMNNYVDELMVRVNLTEESDQYKSLFPFCNEYALTEGEYGFGSNSAAFTMCLIYKLENLTQNL